ncbi:MAG: hypothetical protein OXU20_24360 [Myxococcales bacterium]|nr:hypothetical protein [Myxococcales bacterium]MDD9967015.1 hypothetical protein [Myxococcales bacterium]
MQREPDMDGLIECATAMAGALGVNSPNTDDARALLQRLLTTPQTEGGKEAWACLTMGIVTEVEVRNLLMAQCHTWLLHSAASEIQDGADLTALEAKFDRALYGRPAERIPGVDG